MTVISQDVAYAINREVYIPDFFKGMKRHLNEISAISSIGSSVYPCI